MKNKITNQRALRWWIHDLETTLNPQGHGWLNARGKFCCLGRLCEIYKADTGDGKWKSCDWSSDHLVFVSEKGSSSALLPLPVAKWLGIDEFLMDITFSNGEYASTLNDGGATFKEIAQRLRADFLEDE